MNTSLELWFDFSCPYAYLASRRAPAVARAMGVALDWRPMLLGGVFRGIGGGEGPDGAKPANAGGAGPMPTLGAARARHNAQDMHRWAEIFGVPFVVPAAHPIRTVRALRVLLALPHSRWPAAIEAIFAAYWQRGEDVTSDHVIAGALRRAGTSEDDIAAAVAHADDFKDELRRRTDEAIARGIFGAPAWIVGKELIWGQDRIAWVEAVLAGTTSTARPFGAGMQGFASPRTLDVYFDVASPFAYLGLTQLPALAKLCGVVPRLHPILLGALFRDSGMASVPLFAMPPAKARYVGLEMTRWATQWGVPFDYPTKFPQRTVAAQRLCLLARDAPVDDRVAAGDGLPLAIALGRAMWAEHRDVEDPDTLRGVLGDVGLPREWFERTQEPSVKAALVDETAAAKAAGVFGVPTWIVDGKHLFWGQDRLELVMRALGGWNPP